jgi:hypothetical protein
MPLTFGEKRGFIVLGVALLALMSLVAWLNSEHPDQGEGHPSSYSILRNGGKAAFLLLQQSGYPVERWEKSPADLPVDASNVTLIVAGPESFPRQEEYSAIIRFLVRGGRLLAGTYPENFVPQASADSGNARIGGAECNPAAPTRLTRGGTISQDGDLSWDYSDAAVVHFRDKKGNPVVVSYSVGKGEVIWWASALPLTNLAIRQRGNLSLLLNSVAGSRQILWDEYYHREHTYASGRRRNPARLWALAQRAFFGVLLVLTFSRRSGPVVPLMRESRLSPLEFVETLGNVFQRARGTQVAVEIALNRLQQMAGRRLGIRGSSTPAEIVLAMEQHGLKLPSEVASLVARSGDATTDPELSEKEALQYVRALNGAMRMLHPQETEAERK